MIDEKYVDFAVEETMKLLASAARYCASLRPSAAQTR